jgi:hypothetical protein
VLLAAIVFPEPDVSLDDLKRFPPMKFAWDESFRAAARGSPVYYASRAVSQKIQAARLAGREPSDELMREWRELQRQSSEHQLQVRAWSNLYHAWNLRQGNPTRALRCLRDLRRDLRILIGPDAYRKGRIPPLPAGP